MWRFCCPSPWTTSLPHTYYLLDQLHAPVCIIQHEITAPRVIHKNSVACVCPMTPRCLKKNSRIALRQSPSCPVQDRRSFIRPSWATLRTRRGLLWGREPTWRSRTRCSWPWFFTRLGRCVDSSHVNTAVVARLLYCCTRIWSLPYARTRVVSILGLFSLVGVLLNCCWSFIS